LPKNLDGSKQAGLAVLLHHVVKVHVAEFLDYDGLPEVRSQFISVYILYSRNVVKLLQLFGHFIKRFQDFFQVLHVLVVERLSLIQDQCINACQKVVVPPYLVVPLLTRDIAQTKWRSWNMRREVTYQ